MKRALGISALLLWLGLAPTVAEATVTTIYDIQMGLFEVGEEVTVEGVVVTATGRFGFFIQELDPHPTWGRMNSGIWVYTNGDHLGNVARGDVVDVTGAYEEYFDFSEIDVFNAPPCGQGVNCWFQVTGTAEIPEPVEVTCADVSTGGPFAEAYESVLIKVLDDDPVNPNLWAGLPNQFDEWYVYEDGVGAGDSLMVDSYSADPFGDFDYEIPPAGTELEFVGGILTYSYGNFKIAPRSCPDDLGMPCKPNLRGVWAYDHEQVDVLFAVAVDEASASNTSNYDFDSGLAVLAAGRDAQNPKLVHLTTEPMNPGEVDIAYVSGVLSDGDLVMMDDAEYTFAQGLTTIYATQYVDDLLTDDSDYLDIVVTTTGRVTQVAGNYYFLQEGDAGPFEHLYARVARSGNLEVGDSVKVAGRIQEYFGSTYLSFTPGVQLYERLGEATAPVVAVDVTAEEIIYNCDDEGVGFQVGPNDNRAEPWEDALVYLGQPAYVDSVDGAAQFGEWYLIVAPDSAATDLITDANDDGLLVNYFPTVGDTVMMKGILRYEFGEYNIVPRRDRDIELIHNNATGTGVEELPTSLGRALLGQNQPNPFASATQIAFRLDAPARQVDVEIFDVTGAKIRTLISGLALRAGPYVAPWDGLNEAGQPVSAGTYFYRLSVDGRTQSKQMILTR